MKAIMMINGNVSNNIAINIHDDNINEIIMKWESITGGRDKTIMMIDAITTISAVNNDTIHDISGNANDSNINGHIENT